MCKCDSLFHPPIYRALTSQHNAQRASWCIFAVCVCVRINHQFIMITFSIQMQMRDHRPAALGTNYNHINAGSMRAQSRRLRTFDLQNVWCGAKGVYRNFGMMMTRYGTPEKGKCLLCDVMQRFDFHRTQIIRRLMCLGEVRVEEWIILNRRHRVTDGFETFSLPSRIFTRRRASI